MNQSKLTFALYGKYQMVADGGWEFHGEYTIKSAADAEQLLLDIRNDAKRNIQNNGLINIYKICAKRNGIWYGEIQTSITEFNLEEFPLDWSGELIRNFILNDGGAE